MRFKYLLLFVVLVFCVYMLMTGLFGDTGYFANRALKQVRDSEEQRVELLRENNSVLRDSGGSIPAAAFSDDEAEVSPAGSVYFSGIPLWSQWAFAVIISLIITLLFALPDKELLFRRREKKSVKHSRTKAASKGGSDDFSDRTPADFGPEEGNPEADKITDGRCPVIQRNDVDAARKIADVLANSGIVIMPCDTIYGFVAVADEKNARRISEIKKRPEEKHYITLATLSLVRELVEGSIPTGVLNMWPGPFTAILKAAEGGTIAVRVPKDSLVIDVITRLGKPVYSTSVNISGSPSINGCDEIYAQFGTEVNLVVRGRDKHNSASSAIVDFTTEPPTLRREGTYTKSDLIKIFPGLQS